MPDLRNLARLKVKRPSGALRQMTHSLPNLWHSFGTNMLALVRPRTSSNPLDRITEVAAFGSNPGGLRMHLYTPPRIPAPGAPLIVVLHGCKQDGPAFAEHSGWLDLARRLGIPLLIPQQIAENNPARCFNWFRPTDTARGGGEAMSIRQMISLATRRFGTDRRRVFVVGLSAGGAMAVAMLAAYPAVFAAGAVVAGMPVGSARNAAGAILRMRHAGLYLHRESLAARVRAATPARGRQPWPRLSIWQGSADQTVDPANAETLVAQWTALHGLDAEPGTDAEPSPGLRHRRWGTAQRPGQRPAVEAWTIEGAGHGFPVAAEVTGGGQAAPWVLDLGVPAARRIAEFWGLEAG